MADSSARPRYHWRLSRSAAFHLLGGGALLLVGLLTRRFDVAVLGVPLALAVASELIRRPSGVATPLALGSPRYSISRSRIEADLEVTPEVEAHTVRLRVAAPGHRDREVLLDTSEPRLVRLFVVTARTGRQVAFRVDQILLGAGAVVQAGPFSPPPGVIMALPRAVPLGPLPLPGRLRGLTGSHRSARPGEGGDLRDIAVFGPADRVRRIDWKATARRSIPGSRPGMGTSELYVRRTFATAEAQVVLVLDSRDSIGPDVSTWDSGRVHPDDATSLDIARTAGASLARRYLDVGDRVGLIDLGRYRRPVRPAGGRRHFHTLLHHLATSTPEGEPAPYLRAPHVPSGALVIVLSTFLDAEVAALAQSWRHAGHRTLAVDVLPPLIDTALAPRDLIAYRIVRMERLDRLRDLGASGVEVISWDPEDPGAVEVALGALSRIRRGAR